jgi:hypothetical protein
MPRLDTTLAANRFTAYVPRVDSMVVHGIKYLAQQWAATLSSVGRALGQRAPIQNPYPHLLNPPGPARRMDQAPPSEADNPNVRRLRCAETGRMELELPKGKVAEKLIYAKCNRKAEFPVSMRLEPGDESGVRDAFHERVEMADGRRVPLLPESLTTSSLLNRGLKDVMDRHIRWGTDQAAAGNQAEYWTAELKEAQRLADPTQGGAAMVVGEVHPRFANTLLDPRTGFAASISVVEPRQAGAPREVVVAFGGMGSQGRTVKQALRCFMNIIGMSPPKNFAQASKLTQMVQAHLASLNKNLPPGQPPYTLKLSGHSMGGGMATYAALRNGVKAEVFDPLRLGLGARAKVGREAFKNAPNLVTEVVVQGDFVSDNRASWFWGLMHLPSLALTGRRADAWGAIGQRYLVPSNPQYHPHSQYIQTLSAWGTEPQSSE